MRPSFRTPLFLPPLALAVAALYPLTRASLAPPDPEALTGPWLLLALDGSIEEELGWARQRSEAKRQAACALLDGRLSLRQAAARFRDIDADMRDKARSWHPPRYTEEEWPYRQVLVFVRLELERRLLPMQVEEWATRLEAELREQLQPGGASPPAAEP